MIDYYLYYPLDMSKYVYFEPKGGFNDILCNTKRCLEYCIENKRILLVNGIKGTYNINFSDYFDTVSNDNIIFDTGIIEKICSNTSYSIYPNEFQGKMNDILENKIKFHFDRNKRAYCYNNMRFELFNKKISEDIIIFTCVGSGDGYMLFKQLTFKKSILDICNERYNRLNKPYLGIQIRNTDYTCDYIQFFNNHETLIKSYTEIYMATDNVNVLQFFREKGLQIKNFTTFPTHKYEVLHYYSNIHPHTKFIDMISDIYIMSLSNTLISPSKGGFIRLIKDVMENQYFRAEQNGEGST
jgi:hypothetical protein